MNIKDMELVWTRRTRFLYPFLLKGNSMEYDRIHTAKSILNLLTPFGVKSIGKV